ncbi:lasso peptide biosynthesis B2 protein [Caulobacter sp. LjRoot300]|uniref:lasso peptide biosynthesis B2 protein n=1 Tax=Caulobacter sp. LjRoot300 TaxID=3342321 RepID=UPI003ECCBF23
MFLSATTHLIRIGDDIVVLDARTNAYYCLPAASTVVTAGPAGLAFDDPDLAEQFASAGFLAETPPPPAPTPSPSPRRDLAQNVAEKVRLIDVGLILAACLTMPVSYHGVEFRRLVGNGADPSPMNGSSEPSDEVRRLVATFERVLPWLPFQGACLYRAFLLRRVLRWRGHRTRWVFGVRTWPFLAHCWLQIGDVVLDDAAERLVSFSPIMEV